MPYDIQPVSAPRMTGLTLRLFTRLTERPLVGRAIRNHLKSQIGISRLRTVPIHEEVPADLKLRRRLENVADTPLESDHPDAVNDPRYDTPPHDRRPPRREPSRREPPRLPRVCPACAGPVNPDEITDRYQPMCSWCGGLLTGG